MKLIFHSTQWRRCYIITPLSFERDASYSYHHTPSFKLTVIAKSLPQNNAEETLSQGADEETVSLWRQSRNQESKFLLLDRLMAQQIISSVSFLLNVSVISLIIAFFFINKGPL